MEGVAGAAGTAEPARVAARTVAVDLLQPPAAAQEAPLEAAAPSVAAERVLAAFLEEEMAESVAVPLLAGVVGMTAA